MEHDSHSSNHENESNSQPDDSYAEWQNIMKDAEFHGGNTSDTTIDHEANSEKQEKHFVGLKKIFAKIQSVKSLIADKLGIQSSEKVAEMTDDALVHVAKETIAAADEDGIRTEEEAADIEETVSSVVVQGAMEEAGVEQSAGENPILELNQGDTQSDLMASIEMLHEEGVVLPDGKSVAGLATRTIERDKKWDLKKISGQLGSNEGGWYEKPNGERYYVKFYENPSQGRVEFIANAIYAKLGIKSVRSEIIQMDGREAIASPAVPEATPASKGAQSESEDVQKGFVADAFLANWDVVGLVYDNIVQGKDGFYRIDNGGSLIFRTQGGDKAYSPDSIPELKSMRVSGRPTGEVFAGITEEEIARQARELISKLSPEDIRAIVDESGLDGEERDRVLAGLLGRREYLVKTYGKPESRERRPRRKISETIRMLSSREMEQTGETTSRPRTEIICDHDHIEGQKIDVISKKDRGTMEFKFKLRAPTEAITALLAQAKDEEGGSQSEITMPSGAVLRRGEITYEGTSPGSSYDLCDAFIFEKDGVKVFIADPSSRNGGNWSISNTHNSSGLIRTAIGLVKIEVPSDMDPEETEKILGEILEKDLGVPDALGEVPEESEREYKMARYKWQHAIIGSLAPEQVEQAEKLEREEVFPGYTTLVERGRHQKYLEKYGQDVRAIHHLHTGNAKSIYRVLTQGLMCTTERYTRGVLSNGMSSTIDMDTGGADSVFTRIATGAQREEMSDAVVVFKPEVFDRTDWYTYDRDLFGSTNDTTFSWRLSPDAIFAKVTDPNGYYPSGNEQMFRTGIGARFVECIEVDPHSRDSIIAELRAMGLEEIDGKPIEEIIVPRKGSSSEATPDYSSSSTPLDAPMSWDIPTPVSWESQNANFKQEQAEKQAKLQSFLKGEIPYTSFSEIVDLANSDDDPNTVIMSMAEVAIAQGKKEQLAKDVSEYLKEHDSLDELQQLASDDALDALPDSDKDMFLFLKNTLGLDFGAIYKEALASQPETTPKEELPLDAFLPDADFDWGDWGNWGNSSDFSTPTPLSEETSESDGN